MLFKAVAAALMLAACAPSAWATDLDDCRTPAELPNELRLTACSAVIADGKASQADIAYAHFKRALVLAANPGADPAAVIMDVSKAIELDPKLVEAYAFRALRYDKAMQMDKAIADLSSAIELAPDRWGLYSLRAMIYAHKKDRSAAIADFKAALAHNPPAGSAEMIRQRIAKMEAKSAQ